MTLSGVEGPSTSPGALAPAETMPARIGRFAVLRKLGAGGMGVVYSAYDEELDRKVAIKLLRSEDLGTHEARSRLLREAQAMARLSHPNVVQIYDVGTFGDRVFLAMELVDGVSLRAWLEENSAGARVPEVLDKFVQAGRGLAAAHDAGIVHRDFKPDNVLIGADGRVRVLDFGLARPTAVMEAMARLQTGADISELDTWPRGHVAPSALLDRVTQPGEILGTPAYMSPEQIAGGRIDAAADQFSFSVALYEALYGERPFQGSTWTELTNAISRGRIRAPAREAKVPARIKQAVFRGLATEPRERHKSMHAFLAALTDDPGKRLRKWATAALAVAAVMGPVLALSLREPPCRAAKTELGPIWNTTAQEAVRSAFAATRLPYAEQAYQIAAQHLDSYVAAWTGARVETCEAALVHHTQSEALFDLRMACLDRRKRELSALIATFAGGGAEVVERSSEAVFALAGVEACGDVERLRLGVQPPGDPAVAKAADRVRARLAEAHSLELTGKHREGLSVAQAALEEARSLGYAPVRAEASFQAGSLLAYVSSSSTAISLLLDAIDLAEENRHDELAADIWNRLTKIARVDVADPERAEQWSRRGLAAAKRAGGKARLAAALIAQSQSEYLLARYDESAKLQREALDLAEQELGVSHPLLGSYLHAYANSLGALSQNEEAVKTYEKALAIDRAGKGSRHPDVAATLFDLALLRIDPLRDFERARKELSEALDIWSDAYGPEHRDVGSVHLALANLELEQGRLDAAEEHAKRAAAIYEKGLEAKSPLLAEPAIALGLIEFTRHEYARALESYGKAREIYARTIDAKDWKNGQLASNIGEALVGVGRYREALVELERSEATLRGRDFEDYLAYPLKGKGQALLGMGAAEKAIAPLEEALAIRAKYEGGRGEVPDVKWALARALFGARKDTSRAAVLAREAAEAYGSLGELYRPKRAEIEAWLAALPRRE